jgi:hypothetical protein
MKQSALILLLLVSCNVFAQRLYVHEIQNGNYQSYEKGSRIVLFMLDSVHKTQGTIVKLDSTGFYLRDNTYIRLNQVASILPQGKGPAFRRFFSVVGGVLLVTSGSLYFISGVATLKEEPVLGSAVMLVSAGMVTGGIWLMRHSKKQRKQVPQQIIDNINYRIFIE